MDIDKLKQMLDLFNRLTLTPVPPPTMMEIAGYPHYENVCSNILRFFLDPSSPHGMNTLVLEALLRDRVAPAEFVNVSVEREVSTIARNRLDMVISTDFHVIGIENKIDAMVANPLDDYSTYLSSIAAGRKIIKLILAVQSTAEGSSMGFECITYRDLTLRVRDRIGHIAHTSNLRYLSLLMDLFTSIENHSKGSVMDKQAIEFIKGNEEQIENLLGIIIQFRAELRRKVQELSALISLDPNSGVKQVYWRPADGIYDVLAYDFTVNGLSIAIDAGISATGWTIQVFLRRGESEKTRLRELLKRLEIPCREENRFIYELDCAYSDQLEGVRAPLQMIIDKLIAARA